MSDYLSVLAFAAMPAAGSFFGGLVAEIFDVSERVLSLALALHLAAGVVLAVVGLELVPQALEGDPRVDTRCSLRRRRGRVHGTREAHPHRQGPAEHR